MVKTKPGRYGQNYTLKMTGFITHLDISMHGKTIVQSTPPLSQEVGLLRGKRLHQLRMLEVGWTPHQMQMFVYGLLAKRAKKVATRVLQTCSQYSRFMNYHYHHNYVNSKASLQSKFTAFVNTQKHTTNKPR